MLRRLHPLLRLAFWAAAAGTATVAAAQAPAGAAAAMPAIKLRVVGGLGSINQYELHERPFWTQEVARLSGGRYSADIKAFDRAGVPGAEMARLLQLGVVSFGTLLISQLSIQYPQYAAMDLAGLNPDMASLRASVAAFRPFLEKDLRERHGIEPLAMYVYPAQVLFCKKPLTRLADLAGRRTRVSSTGQADFIEALGGTPLRIQFAQIPSSLEAGHTDCAITGSSSGHTLGLHRVTQHLYPFPVTWGLAIFGANKTAWERLPADLRQLLGRELPRLEERIWTAAERDTAQGLACSTGAPDCKLASKGRMTLHPLYNEDQQQRLTILKTTVLPRWLQRCSMDCAGLWNRTIGAARSMALPER